MSIVCGSQIAICDLPVRIDTYKGCSHGCKYCFATRKTDISKVAPDNCIQQLKNHINGHRLKQHTEWCDWDIPLHWGGMSDPFQPCEKEYKISLQALKVFAQSEYPFIVSTKGKIIADSQYLSLIEKCNAVVQISMVSPNYDAIEPGCPTYSERLKIIKKVAPKCKRLIVRVQPYTLPVLSHLLKYIPTYSDIGVYGVIIEGLKATKKKKGLIKIGADWCYPKQQLKDHFEAIKQKCHDNGIKFYSGENRLRTMGDSLTCCGCDGLDGFKANNYNLNHILNGDDVSPTKAMKEKGTGRVFKGCFQGAGYPAWLATQNMAELMVSEKVIEQNKKTLI